MRYFIIILLVMLPGYADDKAEFEKLKKLDWKEKFSDKCAGTDWKKQWFLDGKKAKVSNTKEHMQIDTANGFAVLLRAKMVIERGTREPTSLSPTAATAC